MAYIKLVCLLGFLGSAISVLLKRDNFCPEHSLAGSITSLGALWSRGNKQLVAECAGDCYRDPRCKSFFYNTVTHTCQGSSNRSVSAADVEPGDAWVYYRHCTQNDCSDAYKYGVVDGLYTVTPGAEDATVKVYCDMKTPGGGWLVIQRRMDGSVDFKRTWDEYKEGFGYLGTEFWLGNDNIHRLTSQKDYKLRIDLADFEDNTCVSTYDQFALADEDGLYMLSTSNYTGECGDSFSYGNGRNFTTLDRDNDVYASNCGALYPSGWWYGACHSSQLNGQYNNTNYASGVCWSRWKGYYYSLRFSEMKIKPV
ncbi:microfibril-associated glycoprotein 4-like [Haliotis cracherodii]|uniref:microfibril-associated glycoprotein 4-like n=1 Tax=Haliotis cracherodii TaxID=6455 RepID=UPI0039EAB1F8